MHDPKIFFLGVSMALAIALGACGGETVIQMPGGAGGSGGGSSSSTTTSSTGGQGGQVGGSGGGGPCDVSCADAITEGVSLCSLNDTPEFYVPLYGCGCGASLCADACTFSLCVAQALDSGCESCLKTICTEELTNCASH